MEIREVAKARKWIVKKTLTVLSLIPVASVAFAASSKLIASELPASNGPSPDSMSEFGPQSSFTARDLSDPTLVAARRSLFKVGEVKKTQVEAYEYFRSRVDLNEIETNIEFWRAVEILKQKGMVSLNDRDIISAIPSAIIVGD